MSNIGTVGCGDVTSTGTVQGNSLSDGTFSVTGGDITGAGSVSCSSITCSGNISGTLTGDADLDQLKANTAVTLNKDASWTELSSITGTSRCFILSARAHTDDDANSIWIYTSDGTTGSCSRLAASAGTTSSQKLRARWQSASSVEISYENSWDGGVGSVSGYAVSLFPAA